MNPNDYVRCPHCSNIVGQRTQTGFSIRHGKRSYCVPTIATCTCERCGKTFKPEPLKTAATGPQRKADRVGYVNAPPGFNHTLTLLMGNQRIVAPTAG